MIIVIIIMNYFNNSSIKFRIGFTLNTKNNLIYKKF